MTNAMTFPLVGFAGPPGPHTKLVVAVVAFLVTAVMMVGR